MFMRGYCFRSKAEEEKGELLRESEVPRFVSENPAITGTKIYVNLAEVELAGKSSSYRGRCAGLLRAESMVAEIGQHPKKYSRSEGKERNLLISSQKV